LGLSFDYAVIYGYSQQVSQAMDAGLRPVVDSVNAIRVPQDYVTQRDRCVRQTARWAC
jgi:hypothetical protein